MGLSFHQITSCIDNKIDQLIRYFSNDATAGSSSRITSRQTTLVSSQSQIIHPFVDHNGFVQEGVARVEHAGHTVLDVKPNSSRRIRVHIPKISNVSHLRLWSTMVHVERVEVSAGSLALVGEVALGVDVEPV